MEEYTFEDALAGSVITCTHPDLEVSIAPGADDAACASLFFPGCSLINYALPLVQSVYGLLKDAGRVDGISLLCCGKILSFEADGKRVRAAFEDELRAHVAASGVERIVAACPNCVKALREALAADERTAQVEIVALPTVLAELGYRVDAEVARSLLDADLQAAGEWYEARAEELDARRGSEGNAALFSVHDSCPDRATGEFADGLRALMPEGMTVDPAHHRKNSLCCGSLARAAGKTEAAAAQSRARGEEAVEAGALAVVTACMSCAFLLSVSQRSVPVFHYLELLYDWRIDWLRADCSMKLRFLFDEPTDGGADAGRAFVGLGSADPKDVR